MGIAIRWGLVLVFGAFLLLGCNDEPVGGGDGPGSNDFASLYFPLHNGNAWNYVDVDGRPAMQCSVIDTAYLDRRLGYNYKTLIYNSGKLDSTTQTIVTAALRADTVFNYQRGDLPANMHGNPWYRRYSLNPNLIGIQYDLPVLVSNVSR